MLIVTGSEWAAAPEFFKVGRRILKISFNSPLGILPGSNNWG